MTPLIALFLVGCAPHDAEMTGNWTAWLPQGSSKAVKADKLDFAEADVLECSGRTEDDFGYLEGNVADCEAAAALKYNTWLTSDGYYRFGGDLKDNWRTDALINSEGDFQLTVHQDLGSGEDFRFAFSIKPEFTPLLCSADANGDPQVTYVDGANWLKEWSADEDGYTIYYLNAGAYQLNPGDSEDYWFATSEWSAGYGAAKFSLDNLSSVSTVYGWDDLDCGSYRGQYWETYFSDCGSTNGSSAEEIAVDIAADLEERIPDWNTEMIEVYGVPSHEFRVEDNTWRTVDGARQGLDGWVGLDESWVRIKDGSNLEAGGSAEGDFQILYISSDSDARVMVSGTFKIDEIGEDKWGYTYLEDDLREENDTPFCGGAGLP